MGTSPRRGGRGVGVLVRRVLIAGLRTAAALMAVVLLAGGCLFGLASVSSARVGDRSPVELRCERTADSVLRVTLRNRAGRAQEVDLLGLAYAGHSGGSVNRRGVFVPAEAWEHWWTQHGVRLAPHGQWSAYFYIQRIEKIEARDRYGRLLADFDVRKLPDHHWDTSAALHRRANWQRFGKAEIFGQRLPEDRWHGPLDWRTMRPSELPRCPVDLEFVRPRVIGDVRAEAFTPEQLDGLRGRVERGATVIICGGADLGRLRGWERSGLLATPARGTRVLPALHTLPQRYGLTPIRGPMTVADVGVVAAPARVALEEGGVPLAVERPCGTGLLIFLTFDPTGPPVRGSPFERPFWQEWLGRDGAEYWDVGVAPETSAAYERARRKLSLVPPPLSAMTGMWLGYLMALLLVLVAARRRARALVALSFGASLGALALGPALRGLRPAAVFGRKLQVAAGASEGWWWGQAHLMMPGSGPVALQVPNGWIDSFWEEPRVRLVGASDVAVRPLFQRWVPKLSGIDGLGSLPGGIDFGVELEGSRLSVRARNRTSQPVRDLTVVWGRSLSLRLGGLAPGQEAGRPFARIGADGEWTGAQDGVPLAYGPVQRSGGRIDPLLLHPPALLAHSPIAPPGLRVDGRPVRMEGETALLVAPAGYRVRGAFHMPREVVQVRMVHAQGRYGTWGKREWWGRMTLEPGARVAFELQLPVGAGRARWRSLALLLDRDTSLTARLRVFDWSRQEWVQAARLVGHGPPAPPPRFFPQQVPDPVPASSPWSSVGLSTPERFVNAHTDAALVRIENEGDVPGGIDIGMKGDGEVK